jgi:hypothetical protein
MVANAVSSFCWAHTEAWKAWAVMPTTWASQALASRAELTASWPLRKTCTCGVRLTPLRARRTS